MLEKLNEKREELFGELEKLEDAAERVKIKIELVDEMISEEETKCKREASAEAATEASNNICVI